MDLSFLNHEALQGMDPRKIKILQELSLQMEGKSMKQMAPVLTKTLERMRREGLEFTREESDLLMQILMQGMSKEERQKVERMKAYMKNKGLR